MLSRRLYAWELWITITLYGMFLWLILSTDKGKAEILRKKILPKNKVIIAYIGLLLIEFIILILSRTLEQ